MSWLSVVTASETYDLTVLATVKQELGITVPTHDALLTRLIHEASVACATYCDRVFALEEVTETFRTASPTDTLRLSRWPVASITSITEDGTALAATDYEVSDDGYLYRLDADENLYTWSSGKTVVTYTGGYVLLTTLPRDIERACISLVKSIYFQTTRDPNVRSVSVPGVMDETFWVGGIGDNGALPPNVTALLGPYRRMSV